MLVITMTSWTGRINNVLAVLRTILKQTVLPDKIYLNLSKAEFTTVKLPDDLSNFIIRHADIINLNWVEGENTKAFKKIFPILKYLTADDIIINIDDDMLLPPTFIESRLKDFAKHNTCISGLQNSINSYARGRLPEVKHYLGAGSVYQKKMFNNWEKLLNKEIIATNHDDAFYCFLCWLNGWVPESCSEFDSASIDVLSVPETSLHGSLGCAGPIEATKTNVKKFIDTFKVVPYYNFFRTNKKAAPGKAPSILRIDNINSSRKQKQTHYLYF